MLAVISCHFNPCGFSRPRQNLHRFRQEMAGVPIYFVELSFDGTFELPPDPNVLQIKGNRSNLLWQKERLINIASKQLPSEITAIAWIDADISFGNPLWYTDTISELSKTPVVQLFEQAYWLSKTGRITHQLDSVAAVQRYGKGENKPYPHPGFAWAMRRELFDDIGGLFDSDIIGSGDAWMAHAFFAHPYACMIGDVPETLHREYFRWKSAIREHVPFIGCVPGGVFHHFHGTREDRQYLSRKQIYSQHKVDLDQEVLIDRNGLWTIRDPQSAFAQSVNQYFKNRKED